MPIPDDCHLAYVVSGEAWYADVTSSVRDEKPELMVQAATRNNEGVAWEFGVREHQFSGGSYAVRVEMFGDAFIAWQQIPELFAALAEGEFNRLDEVRELLDKLGAVDQTDRVGPYGGRSAEQRKAHRLREQAAELLRAADELDKTPATN